MSNLAVVGRSNLGLRDRMLSLDISWRWNAVPQKQGMHGKEPHISGLANGSRTGCEASSRREELCPTSRIREVHTPARDMFASCRDLAPAFSVVQTQIIEKLRLCKGGKASSRQINLQVHPSSRETVTARGEMTPRKGYQPDEHFCEGRETNLTNFPHRSSGLDRA
jgi:hypothetical protein